MRKKVLGVHPKWINHNWQGQEKNRNIKGRRFSSDCDIFQAIKEKMKISGRFSKFVIKFLKLWDNGLGKVGLTERQGVECEGGHATDHDCKHFDIQTG